MYWSRTGSSTDLLVFSLLFGISWLGGWLLVTHSGRLRSRERLTGGLAIGILLSLLLINALAHFLNVLYAFILSPVLVLALGAIAAWRSKQAWFNFRDLKAWPQILAVAAMTVVLTLILRGLAIWDDYHNLPLVSTMAAGNIPPHFYLNPSLSLSFHYGLHILAASAVRVGGLFPWSAWDLARALVGALAIVLTWVWVRRITKSGLAASLGSILMAFGTGTLWLLLLLPPSVVSSLSAGITLTGTAADTGPSLLANLSRGWVISGGPPLAIPFALVDGFYNPIILDWGSSASLPLVGVLMLLLLAGRRRFSVTGLALVFVALLSTALSAEHVFVLACFGTGLVLVAGLLVAKFTHRSIGRSNIIPIGILVIVAGLISLVQGGVLTETVRNYLAGPAAQGAAMSQGFALRWPPALRSFFLGSLSFLTPKQLLIGLAEMGPAVLLAPLAAGWSWMAFKRRRWLEAGLGVGSLFAILIPFFVRLTSDDENIARISGFALQTWTLIAIPVLWIAVRTGKAWVKAIISIGFGMVIFGGVAIFALELLAIQTPTLSDFIDATDARMSQAGWNRLEPNAQIIDDIPYRAVVVYGRSSKANSSLYQSLPDWVALVRHLDPAEIARAGYTYIYMDESWWNTLPVDKQNGLSQPCVKVVEEQSSPRHWRKLLDIRNCGK